MDDALGVGRFQRVRNLDAEVQQRGEDRLPPRRDLRLEALSKVLDKSILVHAHCYRADEIVMLLRSAQRHGYTIATLQHVLEGYKVADEIAKLGAGGSCFSDWWAYKMEVMDAIPGNGSMMWRNANPKRFSSRAAWLNS